MGSVQMDTQKFKLLLSKNFLIEFKRNRKNVVKQVLWPAFVAIIMLLVRGYFVADQRDSRVFDQYEMKSWPPGLDAPYLNSNNESEFLLFYSPSNTDTDKIMQNAVDRMNNEYIKWYSMDEYFLSKLIYEPILFETDLTNIEAIINAQMPTYTLSKTQKANFCCNDKITNYNTFDCSTCVNATTVAQKQQWISETLIDNIKGMYWNPCTRQKLTQDIRLMIKGATCNMGTIIQGR